MKKVLHFLLSLSLVVLCSTAAFAQGVTTATMNGQVTDPDGNPLPGATVVALHTPTGSQYGGITNDDGFYRIANLKVGGPYKVTFSFVGYEATDREGVFLSLGQTYRLDVGINSTSEELDAVEVIARQGDLFDGNRTGSETYVGKEQIESLPTVTRNFYDFARLTPQSNSTGDGLSIAGTNNRYNAIFIDGAVNNDVFGLANSGTNGGQTGMSPISPDALDQVQVVVAPYDVTLGGFAGGGINAVTRSGTNQLSGSAYYFTRNENLAGVTPTDIEGADRVKLDPFNANTFGLRL
ncbi:MAG: carboxypeptidase regulatory-like domain-containing protein, partial [Chitinophagales bacterium]